MGTLAPRPPFLQRSQFTWDPRFSLRQPIYYKAEDSRVSSDPAESPIDVFFSIQGNGLLDPPCFNFNSLRSFISKSNLADLQNRNRAPPLTRLALIDDRMDPVGYDEEAEHLRDRFNGQTRSWESEKYSRWPPKGVNIFRAVMDERELYDKLKENRMINRAERRILFITNLTHLCALAVAVNSPNRSAALLRFYMQRYLSRQVYFNINVNDQMFILEFHLPYYALRKGPQILDARGLRQSYRMLTPYGEPQDDSIYYDAQISFVITGVDEWAWTAYCFAETFFGSEQDVALYLSRHEDGPSGAARNSYQPVWNPREYFLIVLSRRVSQITREWENLLLELNVRLDTYEHAYSATVDANDPKDFFDDADLGRTKSYTKAVSTVRKFSDMLDLTLRSFQDFALGQLNCCETNHNELDRLWKVHFDSIYEDFACLRHWQRILTQKIQTFDRMKDGLVNSSALQESRYATKQGDDIGVLTNMTVAYLPFSLAAAMFSISVDGPGQGRWLFWLLTAAVLSLGTFYIAFGAKVRRRFPVLERFRL